MAPPEHRSSPPRRGGGETVPVGSRRQYDLYPFARPAERSTTMPTWPMRRAAEGRPSGKGEPSAASDLLAMPAPMRRTCISRSSHHAQCAMVGAGDLPRSLSVARRARAIERSTCRADAAQSAGLALTSILRRQLSGSRLIALAAARAAGHCHPITRDADKCPPPLADVARGVGDAKALLGLLDPRPLWHRRAVSQIYCPRSMVPIWPRHGGRSDQHGGEQGEEGKPFIACALAVGLRRHARMRHLAPARRACRARAIAHPHFHQGQDDHENQRRGHSSRQYSRI